MKGFIWWRRSSVVVFFFFFGVGMILEELLDYSVDKVVDDVEKEFDGVKELIGSFVKNLKEKVGSEFGELK